MRPSAHQIVADKCFSKLVVVGDQSSGKSSVLEKLTDIPFPCENGLCTRFATQIILRRAQEPNIAISIIPSLNADIETKEKLRAFKIDHKTLLSIEDFKQNLSKVSKIVSSY